MESQGLDQGRVRRKPVLSAELFSEALLGSIPLPAQLPHELRQENHEGVSTRASTPSPDLAWAARVLEFHVYKERGLTSQLIEEWAGWP